MPQHGVGVGPEPDLSTSAAAIAPPATTIAAPITSGNFDRGASLGGRVSVGTCNEPVHCVRTPGAGVGAGVGFAVIGTGVTAGRAVVVVAGAGTLAARMTSVPLVTGASPHAIRTALASSSMVWNRWLRSFASALSMIAISSRGAPIRSNTSSGIDGGFSVRCRLSTPMKLSASNGTRVVISWNRMQPIA